jgi:2-polyprenyl-6-methoxyphenol hydroxylase-like FAD-dependent oxidoreductase
MATPTARPAIGIVGAGIGGLAAALSLRRAGLPVQVFERALRGSPAAAHVRAAGRLARQQLSPGQEPPGGSAIAGE